MLTKTLTWISNHAPRIITTRTSPIRALPVQHYSDVIMGTHGVSNHQPDDCLLNRLFRCRSKETSKLRVTGLCVGNSPVIGEFPHKRPVARKMFPFDDVIMDNPHSDNLHLEHYQPGHRPPSQYQQEHIAMIPSYLSFRYWHFDANSIYEW